MKTNYNTRSPAVRRLMKEAIELKDPTPLYHAQPLEDNLFEWHFTISGPPGTDYENGRYHGRITLPPEYPMKPPSILLLTPNGRFELNQKICLSASSYHPELWQASWGIRTILLALIGFMPTDGLGTIGSLDCPAEERRRLAQRSLDWYCSVCGCHNRVALPPPEDNATDEEVVKEMNEIVAQMDIKSEAEVEAQYKQQQSMSSGSPPTTTPPTGSLSSESPPNMSSIALPNESPPTCSTFPPDMSPPSTAPPNESPPSVSPPSGSPPSVSLPRESPSPDVRQEPVHTGQVRQRAPPTNPDTSTINTRANANTATAAQSKNLSLVIVILLLCIAGLLIRRIVFL